MKKKEEFKDVFNGLSSLWYQAAAVDLSGATITLKPEYDLPVAVDTLALTQEDPTINHYKIIGLDGDWCSSSTLGNSSFGFTCPTKDTDVLKLAYGADAVNANLTATIGSETYSGHSVKFTKKKVTGTFVLVDEEGTNLMVISNVAVWATPLYDNPGTAPFAIKFTGTIEGAGRHSMAWLKKQAAA